MYVRDARDDGDRCIVVAPAAARGTTHAPRTTVDVSAAGPTPSSRRSRLAPPSHERAPRRRARRTWGKRVATHYGIRTTIEAEPPAEPVASRLRPGPVVSALIVPAALLLTVVIVALLAILAPGSGPG